MELQACWTMCWDSWLIAYRQRKLLICTKYKIILEQSEFQAVVGQSCRDSKFEWKGYPYISYKLSNKREKKSKGLSQDVFHAFQKAIYMEENKSRHN